MSFSSQDLRNLFPQLDRKIGNHPLTYFDNAATTLKHKSMIEAMDEHLSRNVANIHRGVHTLSEEGTIEYEKVREKIQRFLKAKKNHEIIFTSGTTAAINLVAHSYARNFLKQGDAILLSTLEHHSNIVPWQLAAKEKGLSIIETPIDENGEIILEEYIRILKSHSIKVVSLIHISNALGTINPIKDLIKLTRQYAPDAVFMVDAAQSVAHSPIDVLDLDCDFLAFSAHKVYGPTALGVLYGKEELLEKMPPFLGGGDMIDEVFFENTTFNDLPHKFEAGTPPIAEVLSFSPCLDFLNETGFDSIQKIENDLTLYGLKKLSQIEGIKILGPNINSPERRSAIISFTLEGAHHQDLGILLDRQGIAIRTGHHCTQPLMRRFSITGTARASFAPYNTKEEIDRLYNAINKARTLL